MTAIFEHHLTLTPPDRSLITQVVACDLVTGDLYGMQLSPRGGRDDLRFTRYIDGKQAGTMWVRDSTNHGIELEAAGGRLSFDYWLDGRRYRLNLPWLPGVTWDESEVSAQIVPRPPIILPVRDDWCQGEVTVNERTYRLYGVPMKLGGPSFNPDGIRNPNIPCRVEVIVGNQIVEVWDCAHLGRAGMLATGAPIGTRLEPEGLSLIMKDGTLHLMVGIANGPVGRNQQHTLYTTPIAGPEPAEQGVSMGSLAYNINALSGQNGALPVDIQQAAAEILRTAETAGLHIPAVSWYNPASTPEHHVPGFPKNGGVAVDFMVYGDKGLQDFIDGYAWKHRARLGVCWLISRRRIRSTSPGRSGNWTPYTGPSAHTDHTHINFGRLAGTSGYGKVANLAYRPLGEFRPSGKTVYGDRFKPGVKDSDTVYWGQTALLKLFPESGVKVTGDYTDVDNTTAKQFQTLVGDDVIDGELGFYDLTELFKRAEMTDITVEAEA